MAAEKHGDVLLEMRGIVKQFPGVKALDGVDFTLRAGEIHALMGENGAGKSTLIKVLTGVYPRDGGTAVLDGVPVNASNPKDAALAGISTVYQEVNLVPELSVAENICLERQPKKFGMINWRELNRRARVAMKRLDIELDVTKPVSSYSIAVQQMVAIARAVDFDAKMLILDEPTASLDNNEVKQLFVVMRKLAQQGLGIVFVTHFLDQVYSVTDRITVLRNGKFVGEYLTKNLPQINLISAMMGRDVNELKAMEAAPPPPAKIGDAASFVSMNNVSKRGSVQGVNLDIAPGELLGLAGLLGSGRTELIRLLFGADKRDSGTIAVDGKDVSLSNPREAIRYGFGFCPEDRKLDGIIPDLSVRENILLVMQAKQGWLRRISTRKSHQIARSMIKAMNIKTPDGEKSIRLLSGGNQQKAILARWLMAQPRLLMLDEPTRGIDVGAKFEIAKLMESLRKDGMAIVFISSELEEVVRSCGRVAVMRDRHKVGELLGGQISEHAIMSIIAQEHADTHHSVDGRGVDVTPVN